ncbi:MAG: flagellar motor protein MotB [Alphaproteobacteria bacterium]
MAGKDQPIIIKKIKKGGHGHHGGAWKVAYADFVTAMMAFFLLLWLLNATSSEQKAGIAEHFTPTVGLKDSQGIGFDGGQKADTKDGTSKQDMTAPGLVVGQVQQGTVAETPNQDITKPEENADDAYKEIKGAKKEESEETTDAMGGGQEDAEAFSEASEEIKQAVEQDPDLKEYKNNIVVQQTPEGMKIDLIDDRQKPMFLPGRAVLTEVGKKVLDSMVNIIIKTPNNITINGHTDAGGTVVNPLYTNWELSADRSNSARRFLASTQLQQERIVKIIGFADRELLIPDEPNNPRNRRITILLMRGSYFRDPQVAPTSRNILSVPEAKQSKPKMSPGATPTAKPAAPATPPPAPKP